jgi:hypothetical protein
MAVLVEFRIDSPILRDALGDVPDAVAEVEEYDDSHPDAARLFVWVTTPDFDAFETALESDSSVTDYERLVTSPSRSFYRLRLSASGSGLLTYRFAIENDIVPLSSRGTHEGWNVRARFPSRQAIADYWEHCRSAGVEFELQQVFTADDDAEGTTPNLTPEQREALAVGLELGYFDVPRGTSLQSIADSLGISDTAVSYRLRRGLRTLVEESIGSTGAHGTSGVDAREGEELP